MRTIVCSAYLRRCRRCLCAHVRVPWQQAHLGWHIMHSVRRVLVPTTLPYRVYPAAICLTVTTTGLTGTIAANSTTTTHNYHPAHAQCPAVLAPPQPALCCHHPRGR